MSGYRRPDIPARTFVDGAGSVIAYGSRWGGGSPPDDTYSVISNPERFAPLHVVTDALIEWLAATYDVTVEDDLALAAELMHPQPDVVRAVRVAPRDDASAALVFAFTAFPGVIVHAGLLHDFRFPSCGCDACDEIWAPCADELEGTVERVVAGDYSERIRRDTELGLQYSLSGSGPGGRSGSTRFEGEPLERIAAAEKVLAQASRWAPWPTRPV
ncbi:DUF6226 family protein [Microbacterium lacus]|uniref:DUF6226 family protein n=1 Tax=Microbacterium lacus TaxID=415217 RepID=UPI000C2C4A91|nr:DUF6226 family protein [Microbacterium lacus]